MPPWQTVVLKSNVGESWQGLLIIIPTLNGLIKKMDSIKHIEPIFYYKHNWFFKVITYKIALTAASIFSASGNKILFSRCTCLCRSSSNSFSSASDTLKVVQASSGGI